MAQTGLISENILQRGTIAPDFSLPSDSEKKVALHDFLGQPVILLFYPADWSPVCGSELALFNEVVSDFKTHNAQLIGISVDNIWSHSAYSASMNLRFPILADFEPKGAVSKLYGAYHEAGFSSRALFLIDAEGVIQWSYLSPLLTNPGADGILQALEKLPQQRLTWLKNQRTTASLNV